MIHHRRGGDQHCSGFGAGGWISLEAAGTAIATVLAQIGSRLAQRYLLWRRATGKKFDFEAKLSYFKLDGEVMKLLLLGMSPQLA